MDLNVGINRSSPFKRHVANTLVALHKKTRMHSSRMYTVHCSSHLEGVGVSAQGDVCMA